MKTMVTLVSTQKIPVILGYHHVKPQKIVFVLAKNNVFIETVEQIITYLKKIDPKLKFEKLYVDPYLFQETTSTLNKFLKKNQNKPCYFNLTGGTKMMAISAFHAAKTGNIDMFYVDTENKRYIIFDDQEEKTIPITVKLTVNEMIELEGAFIEKSHTEYYETDQRLLHLVQLYLKHHSDWEETSRYLQLTSKESNLKVATFDYITFHTQTYRYKDAVFKYLREKQLLTKLSKSATIVNYTFADEKIKHLLVTQGSILEYYVYNSIKKMGKYNDIQVSVNLIWDYNEEQQKIEDYVRNEIDIIFTYNCQLYCISCKSGKISASDIGKFSTEIEAISEKLGGKYFNNSAIIVTPKVTITKALRNRMEHHEVQLFQATSDENQFISQLAAWVN